MKWQETGSRKQEKTVENTGFFSTFNGLSYGGEGGIRSIYKSLCINHKLAYVFTAVFMGEAKAPPVWEGCKRESLIALYK